ncbi:MAG: bifunctional molybdenum cofactor guanylyltransferase MobA/molybdopterin-guanine dinucleotide biosynthesis adaptor protein MobB [Chlorobium phaeobacteroides]|nr:bifunctional molybdenum cofactor guanylyltransferase MobA/molybdopterin-guanine dinucleotide biosynthesis adaptor protein MobB [Chlorobium phaeobacteroides]
MICINFKNVLIQTITTEFHYGHSQMDSGFCSPSRRRHEQRSRHNNAHRNSDPVRMGAGRYSGRDHAGSGTETGQSIRDSTPAPFSCTELTMGLYCRPFHLQLCFFRLRDGSNLHCRRPLIFSAMPIPPMHFHPYEAAFCGYSGSGKTTLIAAVIRKLSEHFSVGYYKHGCHRFDIDREGKDSFVIKASGATAVMIADPAKQAVIIDNGKTRLRERQIFLDLDLLLVEGLKELPLPKIVMIDQNRKILDLLDNGSVTNVAALVKSDRQTLDKQYGIPVFHRNDTDEISDFIASMLLQKSMETPLFGLVLAGGQSSRMGSDKALISYHRENQLVRTAQLMEMWCQKVFISCRDDQKEHYRPYGYPLITDRYLNIGPLGGLLSAQMEHPRTAWMTVACDLPFLDEQVFRQLSQRRNPFRYATAFMNPSSNSLEPLCSCYEPKSRDRLFSMHAESNNSLFSFLEQSRIEPLTIEHAARLRNINDPESMRTAKRECRTLHE